VNLCVAAPHSIGIKERPPAPAYGFADCAALLDLTCAAFPTGLRQDPEIDTPNKDFKPRSDLDEELQNTCEFPG
jgi:hypothetical protein